MPPSVRFEHVSKKFALYHGRARTIQEQFLEVFSRNRSQQPSKDVFWALKDASFEIHAGQTFGLVGSNGSGKSTALKLMAGILEPTSGQILISGRVSALLELGAGFHPDLTGRENVFLNGSLMGISRKDMMRNFDNIVAFSELEEFIDMPVKHYSSGMYTRLAFAVAIHVDPEILIVDEVLAVGDGAFQRKCMDHIGEMKRSGVTIIMVSHDLDTVARLCTQVAWLDHGRVHRIGEGRSVINEYVGYINELQQLELERQRQHLEKQALESNSEASTSGKQSAKIHEIASSQEGEIIRVETLNGKGEVTPILETGDDLVIRIHYRANIPIERPAFGIGLHRDDGLHITGPNTYLGGYQIDEVDGPGYVDYIVEEMPLLSGRYYVSASMYNEEHTYRYDYVHEIHSFVVQPRTVWDQLGVIRLAATWRLTQESTGGPQSARMEKSKANGAKASDAQAKTGAPTAQPTNVTAENLQDDAYANGKVSFDKATVPDDATVPNEATDNEKESIT